MRKTEKIDVKITPENLDLRRWGSEMGIFSKKSYEPPPPEEMAPLEQPAQAPSKPPPEPRRIEHGYGIDKAIQLMRSLPVEESNIELLVKVIKRTLESTQIRIADIIEDANRKQSEIQTRIQKLRQEVASLESEIHKRKAEIERLEADYAETTKVKERLVLAENLDRKVGAPAKPKAATAEKGAQTSPEPQQQTAATPTQSGTRGRS